MNFQYEITQLEFLEMAWLHYRSSARWKFATCFALLLFLMGVFFYIYANHMLGLVLISVGILFLLVIIAVTSLAFRRAYRRNSRMFGSRTVAINDAGIISDNQLGHSETVWNNYEKYRETNNLFLLYQSADLIGILPKRVFSIATDLEQFRSLLAAKIRSG